MSTSSDEFLYDTFPPGFLWGMGTSAAQCEGGWDADGKGMSIWDTVIQKMPEKIEDKSTGQVALDSYHQYKQDVQMLKSIGAKLYRFSISWPRVLPNGRTDNINQPGIDYYNALIDDLLANGIEPMITLYHWDLPQALQEIGGWLNDDIIDIFGQYAKLCFQKFGDRVKRWTTVNEPFVSGMMSYGYNNFAPFVHQPEDGPYLYVHNQLRAHAQAYRIYEAEFKTAQKGIVGINIDTSNYMPNNKDRPEDVEAANRAFMFRLGWMLDPLFYGKYPDVMRSHIDRKSKEEGREKSRLPQFEFGWSEKMKGALDFVGVNYYNEELVRDNSAGEPAPDEVKWKIAANIPFFSTTIPGWNQDTLTYRCHDPHWTKCGAVWQNFAPCGIRPIIKWISGNYGNPTMMVTETGCSAKDESLEDAQRREFFKLSINAVLKSIKEDGCNVVGYVGWSLLDVWEWASGNTIGFGIVQVDRSSSNMSRTLKDSAKYLSTVFRSNGFPAGTSD